MAKALPAETKLPGAQGGAAGGYQGTGRNGAMDDLGLSARSR